MSKKIRNFTIDVNGAIAESKDFAPISCLNQYWLDRMNKGVELAIVSAPAPESKKQQRLVNKTINRFMFNGTRYALWPLPEHTDLYVGEVDSGIKMLRITTQGRVRDQRKDAKGRGERLNAPYSTRMLAGRLYPGIDLALVQVPDHMTEEEKLRVQNTMAHLCHHGKRYKIVGGTGGAKDGKFYFCEESHEKALASRYQRWPQAAISYFGILVSECEKALVECTATIKVVRDHELGTNDCRGWVAESLFRTMNLDGGALYQFRLGFENTQAKGTFKVMPDEVACHQDVQADIIIPESSIKPGRGDLIGKVWSGPVVFGVRDVSRTDTATHGSYTVLGHASWEVVEKEVAAHCVREIETLKSGIDTPEHEEVLEMLGSSNSNDGYFRIAEGVLTSDADGCMVSHPFIHNTIKQLTAKWGYKLLTGGGMRMPGRILMDDGFLAVENGKLFQGSEWIPYDHCITDQPGARNLCVRFPVRMVEDLLPMNSLTPEGAIALLMERGLSKNLAEAVHTNQLALHGTYILNGKRAKTFGGDYDGDQVAIINSEQYPLFVDYRFGVEERVQPAKDKKARVKSPWFELPSIAFKAMGNQVGVITNHMSSANAADKSDEAYVLAPELQAEIDGLKHNSSANMELVRTVGKKVGRTAWLDVDKKLRSLDELPGWNDLDADGNPKSKTEAFEPMKPLSDKDVVARLYNYLLPVLRKAIGDPKPISEFSGLFLGQFNNNQITTDMLVEGRMMRDFYTSSNAKNRNWLDRRFNAVKISKAKAKELRNDGAPKDELTEAYAQQRKAEADLEVAVKKFRQSSSRLRKVVCGWGADKAEGQRMAWAAMLNQIITKNKESRSSGSILYQAFPQQFADAVAEQTGGEAVLVDTWGEDWTITVDTRSGVIYQCNSDSTITPRYAKVEVEEKDQEGNLKKVSVWKSIVDATVAGLSDEEDDDEPSFDEYNAVTW